MEQMPNETIVSALQALASAERADDGRNALRAAMEALGENASSFSPLLEAMLARAGEVERLRKLACHDELTGVLNRRAFNDALRHEVACMRRGGGAPAVILLDLDGLKALNDHHGHASGDAAIVEMARAIAETLRATDLVARLGGDEFAVLIPDATENGVRAVATRIRRAIEARRVHGRALRVSVGCAIAKADAGAMDDEQTQVEADAAAVMSLADTNLYADKRRRSSVRPLRIAHAA